VVTDEYGAPAGVVTLEDLVEELVGDITDEYDPTLPSAESHDDGSWTVPGWWRIDEIERTTGITLPADGTYETLAGLVLSRLQRLAAVADRVEVGDAVLEVVAIEGWAITSIRVSPPGDPSDHEDEDDHDDDGDKMQR
jgi:CBS domain containing-hemolysin-like protein